VQVPVPGQAIISDQPDRTDPAAGIAVNVTDVLVAYDSEQSVPQSIPVGLEVTVPDPDPALVTVSVAVAEPTTEDVAPPPLPPQPEIIRRRAAVTEVKKDAHWPEAMISALPHPFILERFSTLLHRVFVFITLSPFVLGQKLPVQVKSYFGRLQSPESRLSVTNRVVRFQST
jgi:hypothetical protein